MAYRLFLGNRTVVGGVSLSPARADLVISSTAPAVVRTDLVGLSPAAANLAISSVAPGISATENVPADVGAANLSLSTAAPTVVQTSNVSASPAAANLSFSGTAPDVSAGYGATISPAAASLSLSAVAPSIAIDAYLAPDADQATGAWTNQSGGSVLYSAIDEDAPDDGDFINSSADPVNDFCKIGISNPAGLLDEPFDVMYRIKKSGAAQIDLTVRLIEGSTEIAAWTHSDIDVSFLDVTQTLTELQFASIVDFNNLYVEFEANAP